MAGEETVWFLSFQTTKKALLIRIFRLGLSGNTRTQKTKTTKVRGFFNILGLDTPLKRGYYKPMSNRGRPKGSNSTMLVKLEDLVKFLPPTANVAIGTTWAKQMQKNFGICFGSAPIVKTPTVEVSKLPPKVEIEKVPLT